MWEVGQRRSGYRSQAGKLNITTSLRPFVERQRMSLGEVNEMGWKQSSTSGRSLAVTERGMRYLLIKWIEGCFSSISVSVSSFRWVRLQDGAVEAKVEEGGSRIIAKKMYSRT